MSRADPGAGARASGFSAQIEGALAYWKAVTTELEGPQLEALERQRQNLHRALEFGLRLPETQPAAAQVAVQSFRFAYARGYWREWWEIVEAAAAGFPPEPSPERFRLLIRLGQLRRLNHRHEAALAAHREALAVAQALGERVWAGQATYNLAQTYNTQQDYARAEATARQALALLGDVDEETLPHIATTCNILGRALRDQGHMEAGLVQLKRAAALRKQGGEPLAIMEALQDLAASYGDAGQLDSAERTYLEALDLVSGTGARRQEYDMQYGLGTVYFSRQAWEQAEAALRRIDLTLLEEVGDVIFQAKLLTALGNTVLYQGRLEEADELLSRGLELWRSLDDELQVANALGSIGEVRAAQGRSEEAAVLLDEALEMLSHQPGNAWVVNVRQIFTDARAKLGLE